MTSHVHERGKNGRFDLRKTQRPKSRGNEKWRDVEDETRKNSNSAPSPTMVEAGEIPWEYGRRGDFLLAGKGSQVSVFSPIKWRQKSLVLPASRVLHETGMRGYCINALEITDC